MAHGTAPLQELVHLAAAELVSEVCSVYAARPGEILELVATEGLNPKAIGHTRLRVGEGIVGLCAATAQVMNLPDAQNHPSFRISTGNRRGTFRVHAGSACAACRSHFGRGCGAEPQPAGLLGGGGGRAGDGGDAARRGAGVCRCRRQRRGRRGRHCAARVRRSHPGRRDRHRPGRDARQPSPPGQAAGRRSGGRTGAAARGHAAHAAGRR